jgi:Xaa-Pro dipeptidase
MDSAAIRQNTDHWTGLFAAHLDVVKKRSASALASAGYDSLLLHSGTPPLLFLDDHHLPYRAQAPFKVWAPLNDAPDSFVLFTPGRKPVLLIHQPVDYWHKAPSTPDGYWTSAFEIVSCATREAARAALPRDLSHTAFIGAPFHDLVGWGLAAINPEHLIAQLDFARAAKTPYEVACLAEASVLGVRAHAAAERGKLTTLPPGASSRVYSC